MSLKCFTNYKRSASFTNKIWTAVPQMNPPPPPPRFCFSCCTPPHPRQHSNLGNREGKLSCLSDIIGEDSGKMERGCNRNQPTAASCHQNTSLLLIGLMPVQYSKDQACHPGSTHMVVMSWGTNPFVRLIAGLRGSMFYQGK